MADGKNVLGGIPWFVQLLICEAANLGNLVGSQPSLLHKTPGSIGAIGGKFPIAVIPSAHIWFGVCVSFNIYFVGQFA